MCVHFFGFFPLLRLHAHASRWKPVTLDKHAPNTHINIAAHTHTHTPVSPVESNQIEWLSSGKHGVSRSPLPNSALSNECVQCEVAGARTISLCNYVTRTKNQDVFGSASLSLVQFDILLVVRLSTPALDGTCGLRFFLACHCPRGLFFFLHSSLG